MTDSGTRDDAKADEYPRAENVAMLEKSIKVWLHDGRTLTVPLEWYPMLCDGTQEERNNWDLVGDGVAIHWPDLDEDIGVESMLDGIPCTYNARTLGRWLVARREGRGIKAHEIADHERARSTEQRSAL